MPLIETGTCNRDKTPHVKCNNPSWKFGFKLSFKEAPDMIPDHNYGKGASSPFSFEAWFYSWDRTGDPDVFRLCEISWNASRAALYQKNNPDREEILKVLAR